MKLSDEQKTEIGEKLIELLALKVKSNGRVDTSVGDKTPKGLFLTVKRFIEDPTF
jgi:hypothetical protein